MIGAGVRYLRDRFTPFLRDLAHLAVGTDGQVLTLDGGKPTWGDAAESPVKAWVNFNGTGTIAIRGSENVSSITDNGTGDYTVNFTAALTDAAYALSASCGGGASVCLEHTGAGPTLLRSSSSVRVRTVNLAGALTDAYTCSVSISR